jgi:chromosome segregation ATPase
MSTFLAALDQPMSLTQEIKECKEFLEVIKQEAVPLDEEHSRLCLLRYQHASAQALLESLQTEIGNINKTISELSCLLEEKRMQACAIQNFANSLSSQIEDSHTKLEQIQATLSLKTTKIQSVLLTLKQSTKGTGYNDKVDKQ